MSQALIEALQSPKLYGHPVESFTLVETHISWVLLTGPYAYKIKKPMNFGFLDFSTLEKRRHFCQEELRLNQRLAPDLYLDVVPISGTPDLPLLGVSDKPIEYAVRMKQFASDQQLEQLLARQQLNLHHMSDIASVVADFHQRTDRSGSDSPFGSAAKVMEPVRQNFEQIKPLLAEESDLADLERVESWAQDTFNRLLPLFEKRKETGMIRECHGDLHLGNITLVEGQVTLFDCIEFNESFRWIDTISEIAFFAMDLEDRGLTGFASHFINAYLERSGDYSGLQVLNFYKSYRALVRAKVALFRLQQEGADSPAAKEILIQYRSYIRLAQSYMSIPNRYLLIMHGYSGTGKTTVSSELVKELGLIRLRSDVERKRFFSLPGNQDQLPDGDIYSHRASELTFKYIANTALEIFNAGSSLVIDATFLQKPYRDMFSSLAEQQGIPLQIIDCQLDDTLVRERIKQRAAEGTDPSDADLKVYEMQLSEAEPLDEQEAGYTLTVDCSSRETISAFIQVLKSSILS